MSERVERIGGQKIERQSESPLRAEGARRRSLPDGGPIVPVSGLALAPWRLHQVAGRSSGQNPRASLDICDEDFTCSRSGQVRFLSAEKRPCSQVQRAARATVASPTSRTKFISSNASPIARAA